MSGFARQYRQPHLHRSHLHKLGGETAVKHIVRNKMIQSLQGRNFWNVSLSIVRGVTTSLQRCNVVDVNSCNWLICINIQRNNLPRHLSVERFLFSFIRTSPGRYISGFSERYGWRQHRPHLHTPHLHMKWMAQQQRQGRPDAQETQPWAKNVNTNKSSPSPPWLTHANFMQILCKFCAFFF